MIRKGIGLDIGTTQTTICTADDGILLKEPTVAAVDADTDEVLGAGHEAIRMVERSPDRLRLCWPVWDPVVKSAPILAAILKIFFHRALGRTVLRPSVMVSIPCDLTEAQTNAVEDAVLAAGAHRVHLLEAPLCAALGVGIDFAAPNGQLLIHIGASRTEVAMIFLGDMLTHSTVPVGGSQFDSAIIRYVRDKHKLYIGRRTAEQIKIRIGKVGLDGEEQVLDVKGRALDTKEPRIITISSKEMVMALHVSLASVLDAVVSTIEQTPEELRDDIRKSGLLLTGGALLQNMDQFFADLTGLRAKMADNANTAAAEGAAIALMRLFR